MDPLSLTVGVLALIETIYQAGSDPLRGLIFYTVNYGFTGVLLSVFGNSNVWKMQFEVLVSEDPQMALDFKNARQKENDTVAIAGSILAQIAITSFSLSNLSQAHWTARGFLTLSLVASVISVYYASAQQKTLSRILGPEDIRSWIRTNPNSNSGEAEVKDFFPSAAAVLTVSAPNALLSLAVHAFLIGFGIYLGLVWTENLDQSSTPSGNKAIFIIYVVSASLCYCLYALSNTAASGQSNEEFIRRKLLLYIAHSTPMANVAPSSSMGASGRGPRFQTYSSEIQQILRDSAQLKRELATLDDRIAQLLGNFGHLDDNSE